MSPSDLPEHVAAKIAVDDVTGCWLWQAQISAEGYGRIKWNRHPAYAHRVVFHLLADRSIPVHSGGAHLGLTLDHLCYVRNCVNPTHLEPVTCRENRRRAAERSHRPFTADDNRHGTCNGYNNFACRCARCRAAYSTYYQQRKARRAAAA